MKTLSALSLIPLCWSSAFLLTSCDSKPPSERPASEASTTAELPDAIKIGMPQEKVLNVAGSPDWKGKTFLGDEQWDYKRPSERGQPSNSENKEWVVFDAKGKVKEIWHYRACHLGIQGIAISEHRQLEESAEQSSSGQPASRSLPESEGSDKPQPEVEERSR